MSLIFTPAFGGSRTRPIGVLLAGSTPAATERMTAAFAGGQHGRLWLCSASGRPAAVALLDSIHFDLVVCDDTPDPLSAELVSAVRRSPYGGSLLVVGDDGRTTDGERVAEAVHRMFGLEVPAPLPVEPHPIDTARGVLRRPA